MQIHENRLRMTSIVFSAAIVGNCMSCNTGSEMPEKQRRRNSETAVQSTDTVSHIKIRYLGKTRVVKGPESQQFVNVYSQLREAGAGEPFRISNELDIAPDAFIELYSVMNPDAPIARVRGYDNANILEFEDGKIVRLHDEVAKGFRDALRNALDDSGEAQYKSNKESQ